ncbi:hypothetical protein [Synechococcus sp. CC9616]|uniref:hypothetical protein n=1 Tax=Synechococcus sp. CC9616 TaxID=110663 RepID=UPI00048BF216|nr:hypothetical protein [Synechococcus sp. CC9616]
MANPIRNVVMASKEDTASVLSTGEHWESLRAAYWGHHQQNNLADDCFQKAQEYGTALDQYLAKLSQKS